MSSSNSVRHNFRLTALESGIVENRPAMVKQCIDDGVDVNAITLFSGVRPLELALNRRNVSIMRLLLEGGADTEGINARGSTILIEACRYGYLECVKLLIEHGANLYSRDIVGKTCVDVALEIERYPVAAYLLGQDTRERSARPRDGLCLLQHLILTDDAVSISNLRHCEVDLNVPCPDGTAAVFFAIKYCKNKSLKGLLQAGANPNIQNASRVFALNEAVRQKNLDAARQLTVHGADSHLKDAGMFSPIRMAVYLRHKAMVRLLLDRGAGIDQDLGGGTTPLRLACSLGFQEGVQLLVERGANVNARSVDGETCLLLALKRGHHSVVDYLLDHGGCEVNGSDGDGLTALHHAVLLNNVDMMHKFVQRQADVNVQNRDGEVPVFLAAKHGKVDMLRILLEAGADPNVDTKDGTFPLHEAVKHGDIEAVRLLLQHGADKNRLNKSGMTPLEAAMALVPPPEDIIHSLLTDYMGNEGVETPSLAEDHVEDNKKISASEAEQSLCCPITFEVMTDPVIAMDGHTYEREAIEQWIREKGESPLTRQSLTSNILIPNLIVKHLIDQFAKMNGGS